MKTATAASASFRKMKTECIFCCFVLVWKARSHQVWCHFIFVSALKQYSIEFLCIFYSHIEFNLNISIYSLFRTHTMCVCVCLSMIFADEISEIPEAKRINNEKLQWWLENQLCEFLSCYIASTAAGMLMSKHSCMFTFFFRLHEKWVVPVFRRCRCASSAYVYVWLCAYKYRMKHTLFT